MIPPKVALQTISDENLDVLEVPFTNLKSQVPFIGTMLLLTTDKNFRTRQN